MKKLPKKIYLDAALVNFIDRVSEHYSIPKSNVMEDLMFAAILPESSVSVRLKLIENDLYYENMKMQLKESLV